VHPRHSSPLVAHAIEGNAQPNCGQRQSVRKLNRSHLRLIETAIIDSPFRAIALVDLDPIAD
jgi:hypothetical protein